MSDNVLEFKRPGDWGLVLEFDSDEPEFTRGVEVGRMYEALAPRKTACVEFQVHATNKTMIERVAVATGYTVEYLGNIHDDDRNLAWISVRFVWRAT